MSNRIVLSANTFLYLLYSAKGKMGQVELFNTFAKLADPDYYCLDKSDRPFANEFSRNAITERSSKIPFCTDQTVIEKFNDRVRKHYDDCLLEVEKFFFKHFGHKNAETVWLSSALICLLRNDERSNDRFFFISKKAENKAFLLSEEPVVDFCGLLLGLWHYCCMDYLRLLKDDKASIDKTIEIFRHNEELMPGNKPYVNNLHEFMVYSVQYPSAKGSEESSKFSSEKNKPDILDTSVYKEYFEKSIVNHSKQRTFIYPEEQEFDNFFILSDISKAGLNPEQVHRQALSNNTSDMEKYERIPDITFGKLLNLEGFNRYLLLGMGGIGKSMFLTHLFLDVLKHHTDYYVPFFVKIRDYTREQGLINYIIKESEQDYPFQKHELESLLAYGQIVLFIDGIDEIDANEYKAFKQELRYMIKQYSKNVYILSSRVGDYSEYGDITLPDFQQYYLRPFTPDQAIRMIKKIDKSVISDGNKKGLIKAIEENRYKIIDEYGESTFLGNPLMVSIMALTYNEYREIPTQKHVFYEDAYTALSQKHDAVKGMEPREFDTGLTRHEFKKFFSGICAAAYYEGKYDYTEDSLERHFNDCNQAMNKNLRLKDFIHDVTKKVCLLYRDGKYFSFIHRSFQEYFTAYYFFWKEPEYIADAYEMFDAFPTTLFNDETLPMLYGMDDILVERGIIMPFIQNYCLIEGGKEERYRNFLNHIYVAPAVERRKSEKDDERINTEVGITIFLSVRNYIMKFIMDYYFPTEETSFSFTKVFTIVKDDFTKSIDTKMLSFSKIYESYKLKPFAMELNNRKTGPYRVYQLLLGLYEKLQIKYPKNMRDRRAKGLIARTNPNLR